LPLPHHLATHPVNGSLDLVDAMSVPVRDEDPEPVEASFVLLDVLFQPFEPNVAGLVPASASRTTFRRATPRDLGIACWQRWAYLEGATPDPGRVAPLIGVSRSPKTRSQARRVSPPGERES
jgi:hypothetical protein